MRLNFGTGRSTFGMTTKDVPGMYKLHRFIVLSEISSNSVPNILDIFFGLFPGGIDCVDESSKKTRVMVINNSEVHGTYYGLRDSRTRNVFIHHGMADCAASEIQGDTPIFFKDVDWNVIVDKPDEMEMAVSQNKCLSAMGEVNLSYDSEVSGDNIFRPNGGSKKILIPTPEFYDEKDMVLVGNREENYMDMIYDAKEKIWESPDDSNILSNMYTLTLNDLIDENTKIFRLNIKIENLSSFKDFDETSETFDSFVEELCANTKFALEKSGFSSAEIIYDGKNGYNVSNLKTYMNLTDIEKRINYMGLCYELDSLNEAGMYGSRDDISIIMTLNYSNIHVKIIDKIVDRRNDNNTTDSDVLGLSQMLRESTANMYMS